VGVTALPADLVTEERTIAARLFAPAMARRAMAG
jgi:hypothetical protein